MDTKKLQQYKTQLEKNKAEIEKEIAGLNNVDFGDDIDGGEEESDETEETINNEVAQEMIHPRLVATTDALQKIKTGVYGICESCGKEISSEILDIDPESRLCKACKKLNK